MLIVKALNLVPRHMILKSTQLRLTVSMVELYKEQLEFVNVSVRLGIVESIARYRTLVQLQIFLVLTVGLLKEQ